MFRRLIALIVCSYLLNAGVAHADGKIELLWYGQSAFKLTTPGGKIIMIDPWITANPVTPPELKDLDKLGKVDLILVTHAHGDHLGNAMEISKKNNVPMWGPAGMNQFLATLGLMPASLVPRMNKSGTIEPFPGIKITQVHAEHSSELLVKD
ncbi:MAG: metal-dependent hydrolase, partial [Tardiphaga sp.]|nr:metal-dependent hydrolase [Tardiphaga sp.]